MKTQTYRAEGRVYTRRCRMVVEGRAVYVYAAPDGAWKAFAPGDMMELTDQMSERQRAKVQRRVGRTA
jgi:hypothetical protein